MKFAAAFNTEQYNDSLLMDLGLDPYRQKGGMLGSGWLLVSHLHSFLSPASPG